MTAQTGTASGTATPAWRRLQRVTGAAGLATMVLVFVPLIAGSEQEPDFDATADEILTYFRSLDTPWANFGNFVLVVGLMAFLWFVVCLATLLRRVEGEPSWRSTVAVASGVVLVALTLQANGDAAVFRSGDVDPAIARYAFDQGNLSFANAWVALGSFALCCGWIVASTGFLPRWLGWWAMVAGIGLALSRAVWTSAFWLLPYGMFWLWVIVVSVLLIRRASNDRFRPTRSRVEDA